MSECKVNDVKRAMEWARRYVYGVVHPLCDTVVLLIVRYDGYACILDPVVDSRTRKKVSRHNFLSWIR